MNPSLEDRVAKLEKDVEVLQTNSNGSPKICRTLAEVAGIGSQDPLFEQWKDEIAERRREIDTDPSAP